MAEKLDPQQVVTFNEIGAARNDRKARQVIRNYRIRFGKRREGTLEH